MAKNKTIKIIFIAAVIFFVVAVGVGWYLFYFRASKPAAVTNGGSASFPINNLPVVKNSSAAPPLGSGPVSAQVGILTELFSSPVAGATIIGHVNDDFARITERATGHVDDISLINGQEGQLSNTTVPKIYQSLWLANGSTTILQYLDTDNIKVETYSATLTTTPVSIYSTSTAPTTGLLGTFLPANIESIAANPSGKQIFYIESSSGKGIGVIANPDGSKASTIFGSPIDEWTVQWPSASTITLTTKPASGVPGFMYFLSTKGVMTKKVQNINGLVTNTDPTGTLIAYSDDNLDLNIFNTKTGVVSPAPFHTVADKCVWSSTEAGVLYCAVPQVIPQASYPDSWYQGLTAFSDDIDRFDTINKTLDTIVGPQSQASIDAMNLTLSPDGDYLIFTNKNDLTLWGVRLFSETITQGTTTSAQ